MSIELLPLAQADALVKHPVKRGLLAQLTERTQDARRLREKRMYACRHCEQTRAVDVPVEAAEAPEAALSEDHHVSRGPTPAYSSSSVQEKTRGSRPKAGQGRPSKLFTFDGFRSHAIAKYVCRMSLDRR